MQAILGLVLILLLAFAVSENRKVARSRATLRLVGAGLAVHIALALILLQVPWLRHAILSLNVVVDALSEATKAGTAFVFGYIGGGPLPFDAKYAHLVNILAFRFLPLMLVISALSALLFHWRILPAVVGAFSWALRKTLGVRGPLGVGAAVNVFVGMIEAPLLVRPYLATMSRGELFALMTVGLATVAGTVMVLYATFIAKVVPGSLGHILTASILNVPAALMVAALMVPFVEDSRDAPVRLPRTDQSTMDALVRGTADGLQLLLNVTAMLLVLVALVALVNIILTAAPDVAGKPLTLERMMGWVLAPVAWLIGIKWDQAADAGALLGTKVVLNELKAYLDMAGAGGAELSARTKLILTYAMCGFANFGSVGIMIGGMASMVPDRRAEIAGLAIKSLGSGLMATLFTGAMIALVGVGAPRRLPPRRIGEPPAALAWAPSGCGKTDGTRGDPPHTVGRVANADQAIQAIGNRSAGRGVRDPRAPSAMKILLGMCIMATRTGAEWFVRDVALDLNRRGHSVAVYAPIMGDMVDELRAVSIACITDLEAMSGPPDVIVGNTRTETVLCLARFPGVPAISICHDRGAEHGRPPIFSRIRAYVAVDDNCAERLLLEHGIAPEKVAIIQNGVDLDRFRPRPPLPERPRRAAVFSNYATPGAPIDLVRQACAEKDIALDVIGSGTGNLSAAPEEILGDYDLVFAKARCATEALAVGCAVVALDQSAGMAGMVDCANVAEWRRLNFGNKLLARTPITLDGLRSAIGDYSADESARVGDYARAHFSLAATVDAIESLAATIVENERDADPVAPETENREFAQFVANSLRPSGQTPFAEQVGLLQEQIDGLRSVRHELDAVYASRSWRVTAPLRWLSKTVRRLF